MQSPDEQKARKMRIEHERNITRRVGGRGGGGGGGGAEEEKSLIVGLRTSGERDKR